MQKRTILMLISSIVMLLLTTVTFVFAWFTIVEKTQKIIISSGNVKMEYSLFEIINDNNDERPITGPIPYKNLVPGDNFKYHLKIKNIGNLDALLSISFEFQYSNIQIAEAFKLSYYQNSVEENEVTVDFTENIIVLNDYELNPDDDDYIQKFFVEFDSDYEKDFSVNSNYNSNYVKIKTIKITLSQKN